MSNLIRGAFLLGCIGMIPALSHGASAVSSIVGVTKSTLKGGGKYNLVSVPFVPAVLASGTVSVVSGTSVTLSSADLSAVSSADYVEVTSGSGIGQMADIVSVSGSTIVLAEPLGISVGNTVAIRAIPTIASVFGSANTFGLMGSSDGNPENGDQILVLNPATQETDTYFYSTVSGNVGWYDATNFTAADGVLLYPERGMIVRVNGPDVSVYFSGDVKTTPTQAAVFRGFNIMSVMNPLQVTDATRLITLSSANLYTGSQGTGVTAAAAGDVENADWLYTLNVDTQEADSFFYSTMVGNIGWYDTTNFGAANALTLSGGSAFYLYHRGLAAFSWTQPVNHMPAN
jgi:hypothetical protein